MKSQMFSFHFPHFGVYCVVCRRTVERRRRRRLHRPRPHQRRQLVLDGFVDVSVRDVQHQVQVFAPLLPLLLGHLATL